jgi:hypothetical protein
VGGYANTAPPPPAIIPYGSFGAPFSNSGYGGYGWGYQNPTGAALQGYASVTAATGQYYNQIQQARITREQSRQMALDTQRKQIEQEIWYESVRPTAPKMMAQEKASDLDWARNYAQNTEIWSGRTLNVLLKSVLNTSYPTRGPNIPLNEVALKGLNLNDGTTRANLSLAKDEGKITWPEALAAESFDSIRDSFSKDFEAATRQASTSGPPPRATMNKIRGELKKMEDKLEDQVTSLDINRYIEARRLIKQLKENVNGLSDPKVCKACHASWRKNVRTVGDLVGYCLKNGLQFGAAANGDEPSYTVTYHALRNYERSITRELSAAPN